LPQAVAVDSVLVAVLAVSAVDANDTRVGGIAAGVRMIFQLAQASPEGHVLGTRDVLPAKE
jgi:hypothetical protein